MFNLKGKNWFIYIVVSIAFVLLLFSIGFICDDTTQTHNPQISSIEGNGHESLYYLDSLTIFGKNFDESTQVILLGNGEEHNLAIEIISETEIKATIPDSIPIGQWELKIKTSHG